MKKLFFFLILAASLFIIRNFVLSIYDLWRKHDLLTQAQTQLQNEKRKQSELTQKLRIAQTSEFVETEARNKLFLVKPGESQVVLPQDDSSARSGEEKEDKRPYWQLWRDLFFAK